MGPSRSHRTFDTRRTPRALLAAVAAAAVVVPLAVTGPAARADTAAKTKDTSAAARQKAADADAPVIVSPAADSLVTRGSVRVCARNVDGGFRAIVGASDIRRRFHDSGDGVWCARLRRGHELRRGENRVVVSTGTGATLRHGAREFTVGRHRHGMLRMRLRRHGHALLAVHLRGPNKKPFESVRVELNGKRVDTRTWVVGERTPSTQWPLGARRFNAVFGADGGVRHGMNRLTVTAWRSDGSYDRARVHTRVPKSAPLVAAGDGARAPVGRTVSLDASQSSPPGGAPMDLTWHVVDAPDASNADLHGATTSGPTFVPDTPGTYRLRLTAKTTSTCPPHHHNQRHHHRGHHGRFHHWRHQHRCHPKTSTAVDETTIKAPPPVGAMGAPVTTITANGSIKVGDTTYAAKKGSWAQLVVLDRATLGLVRNQSFNPEDGSTEIDVQTVTSALWRLSHPERDLVILSGGGRSVSFGYSSQTLQAISGMFAAAGSPTDPFHVGLEPFADTFTAGQWSLVGVPGTGDSATVNLSGLRYGMNAGDDSQPGALTGYLRADAYGNFGFASAEHATLNTNYQSPQVPTGENWVQVGDEMVKSSNPGPDCYAGFHVVVLGSRLNAKQNKTFCTNGVGNASVGRLGASDMAEFLRKQVYDYEGNPAAPGDLVIINSLYAPFGWQSDWVDDAPIIEDKPGHDSDKVLHRGSQTWYLPEVGHTLAQEIGQLGGVAAHDAFAKLSTTGHDGYSLVASIGQMFVGTDSGGPTPTPIIQSSTPTSVALTGNPGGRVVGNLVRDHQGLWKLSGASAVDKADFFQSGAMMNVINQKPTAWPAWGTAGERAADCYIASQEFIGAGYTSLRQAYPLEKDETWHGLLSNVTWRNSKGKTCPSTAATFTKHEFHTVKAQLRTEVYDVGQVANLVGDWQKIYGTSQGLTGYIDLQTIAQHLRGNINRINDSDQGAVHTERIIADSLKLAGAAASVVPMGGAPFGIAANTVALMADTSTQGNGAPSLAPLNAEVDQLGPKLVDRYQQIGYNLDVVYQILVSDWGKLQTTAKYSGDWLPKTDSPASWNQILTIGAKQEIYSALLPTVYGLYYVDPAYVMNGDPGLKPASIVCSDDVGQRKLPWRRASQIPSAWERPVIHAAAGPSYRRTWLAMSTRNSLEPDQPDLSNLTDPTAKRPPPPDSLFAPVEKEDDHKLGMDKTTLFADPRFTTRWFWCRRYR